MTYHEEVIFHDVSTDTLTHVDRDDVAEYHERQ